MLQTLHLLDASRVRRHIPHDFDLIQYGSRTLGGIYYARYGPGSAVEYNELGVFLSFVRFQGRTGIWVSNMYVDSEQSLAMAHEKLGLPKEMAEFAFESGDRDRITVHQRETMICALAYSGQVYGWRQRAGGSAFGVIGRDVVWFRNDWHVRGGITRAGVEISPESPLAVYGLERPFLTLCGKDATALLGRDHEIVGRLQEPH